MKLNGRIYVKNLDLEDVLLDLLLHRVVGELLIGEHVEESLELLIRDNLTTISRVLKILLLNVLAELLGYMNTSDGLLSIGLKE